MIVADRLTKRFGARLAVDDVSFDVQPGEVVGFLGPNGAGKTTTLRLLAGVFPPTAGRALVAGHDVAAAPRDARRRLGYAPERPALHAEMTVAAELAYVATLRDVPARGRAAAIAAAVAATDLGDVATRRIGTLSKGTRQRVGLALALVGDPPALLLDEPLAGLDPAQNADARSRIRGLAGAGRAVLVSSHALADVEQMADRVVILHGGRVLAADTPAALAARLRLGRLVEVEVRAPGALVVAALAAIPGVERTTVLESAGPTTRCRVEVRDGDVRAAIAGVVIARGWSLLALAPVEPGLEDAFLALTGHAA